MNHAFPNWPHLPTNNGSQIRRTADRVMNLARETLDRKSLAWHETVPTSETNESWSSREDRLNEEQALFSGPSSPIRRLKVKAVELRSPGITFRLEETQYARAAIPDSLAQLMFPQAEQPISNFRMFASHKLGGDLLVIFQSDNSLLLLVDQLHLLQLKGDRLEAWRKDITADQSMRLAGLFRKALTSITRGLLQGGASASETSAHWPEWSLSMIDIIRVRGEPSAGKQMETLKKFANL